MMRTCVQTGAATAAQQQPTGRIRHSTAPWCPPSRSGGSPGPGVGGHVGVTRGAGGQGLEACVLGPAYLTIRHVVEQVQAHPDAEVWTRVGREAEGRDRESAVSTSGDCRAICPLQPARRRVCVPWEEVAFRATCDSSRRACTSPSAPRWSTLSPPLGMRWCSSTFAFSAVWGPSSTRFLR